MRTSLYTSGIILCDTKKPYQPKKYLAYPSMAEYEHHEEYDKHISNGYDIWVHLFIDTTGEPIFIYYPKEAEEGQQIKVLYSLAWVKEGTFDWVHGKVGLFAALFDFLNDIYNTIQYDI